MLILLVEIREDAVALSILVWVQTEYVRLWPYCADNLQIGIAFLIDLIVAHSGTELSEVYLSCFI